MLLEEKIKNLNQNTPSKVSAVCFQVADSVYQDYHRSIYSRYLNVEDESRIGYRDNQSYQKTINEGQINEADINVNQNIVWTEHGPLIRTNELIENKYQSGPYDRYFVVSFEGFFLMPSSPKNDLPPRYEYVNVSRTSYFKSFHEVASYTQGVVQVDDQFMPIAEGVEQRNMSPDGAFNLFERQFNTAIDFSIALPVVLPTTPTE